MSRTIKDRPYWVAATWWVPWHGRCPDTSRDPRHAWYGTPRACDLPDAPDGKRPALGLSLWRHCHWTVSWEDMPPEVRRLRHVPSWFAHRHYHDPQRARVRDTLRAARADWRANGDTDIEPEPIQARSSAHWHYH